MSVKVMGIIWDYYPNGGGELLTALAMADKADHDGEKIWPAIDTVASMTKQSRRTVQRQIAKMVESGWLVMTHQGGSGPGDTTRYRMPIELIPQGHVGRVPTLHPYRPELSTRVQSEAAKGAKSGNKGATAMAHKPSLERPLEQGEEKPEPPNPDRKQTQEMLERLRQAATNGRRPDTDLHN